MFTATNTAQLLILIIMSNDNYDQEAELKTAKRAEIERLYFEMELTNEELLAEYKALDVKEEDL